MSNFQQSFEPSYEPYQRFQGSNFWVNTAVGMGMPNYGAQDWIGGSLNSPYRTLSDQFSAFQKDQMFQKMFEYSSQNGAQQVAQLPTSMLGAFMAAGNNPMTATHQANIQDSVAKVMPFLMTSLMTPEARQALDVLSGGSNIANANVALAFQHRRLYDPITGAQGLSFESLKTMSDAGYARIFGTASNPNAAGLYGAGAAELSPLLNFMNRHAMINTTMERSLFDENFLRMSQSMVNPASRKQLAETLMSYGMHSDDVKEFMSGGNAYDQEDMRNFMQRASGSRTFEDAKSLKNLTNAIRELAGPDVVTNLNEALAALESLAGSELSQFSKDNLANIVRNGANALKTMGLGLTEFSAFKEFSSARAAQMGYQGAMGLTNAQYMSNERMAMGLRGAMSSPSYGLWNENQLVQALGDSRLAYGKSEFARMEAGMLMYAQTGGEFADNEAGRKLRAIMNGLAKDGVGGDEWNSMTMDERMALFAQGMKDNNALTTAMDFAGNAKMIESFQGSNPNLLDNGKAAQRAEMERYAQTWAATAAAKAGFGGNLADSMTKSLFALEGVEAKDPVTAARAIATRMLANMSEAERQQYGANYDEQVRKLSGLTSQFVNSAMNDSNTGANLGNFLNQFGDNAMAAYDATKTYNELQTRLDNITQSMQTTGVADLAAKLAASAREQLDQTGSVDIRKLLDAGLSTLGPGDKQNREKLRAALSGLADEEEALTMRYAELQGAGKESSVEGKNIKNKLDMIRKYITTFDEVMNNKLDQAESTSSASASASSGGAVFNNLVMNMPDGIEVRIGNVVATPQAAGAVT